MKSYQRRAKEQIDDIILMYEKKCEITMNAMLTYYEGNQSQYLNNVTNYNNQKEALTTATTLKSILEGNNKVTRILSITSYISDILFQLNISNAEKKELFFDLVAVDYQVCLNNLNLKSIALSLPQKIFLQNNQIPLEQLLYFLDSDLYKEKIYQNYPKIADKVISIIEDSRKELFSMYHIFEAMKKCYLDTRRQLTKESYSVLMTELKKLGINRKIFELLKQELQNDIKKETELKKENTELKEEQVPETKNEKKLRSPAKNSKDTTKFQELIQYFNVKLGETKRALSIVEQEKLIDLLIYHNYTDMECKNILQKSRATKPYSEKFVAMDLIERIKMVRSLRKTYHTEREILEILKRIDDAKKDPNQKLTKEQQVFRNAGIIKLIKNYLDVDRFKASEFEQIRQEIKQIPKQPKQNWEEERTEWKSMALEILTSAYFELVNPIVIEESKKNRTRRNKYE